MITSTPIEQFFSIADNQTHKNSTSSTTDSKMIVSCSVRGAIVRSMVQESNEDKKAQNLLKQIEFNEEIEEIEVKAVGKKRLLRSKTSLAAFFARLVPEIQDLVKTQHESGKQSRTQLQGRQVLQIITLK